MILQHGKIIFPQLFYPFPGICRRGNPDFARYFLDFFIFYKKYFDSNGVKIQQRLSNGGKVERGPKFPQFLYNKYVLIAATGSGLKTFFMSQLQKLRINFKKFTDSEFDLLAAYILICMTGNTFFPNPTPTLEQLSVSLGQFREALEGAKTRASLAIAQKNAARRELESILKSLGLYLMSVGGDEVLALASTGYPFTKVPGLRTISNPGYVLLEKGDSTGEMVASVKPDKPAPSYIFQVSSTDPEGEVPAIWNSFGSTVGRFKFTNLVPGGKYWVRVIAIGSRGQTAYSPVSSDFVS